MTFTAWRFRPGRPLGETFIFRSSELQLPAWKPPPRANAATHMAHARARLYMWRLQRYSVFVCRPTIIRLIPRLVNEGRRPNLLTVCACVCVCVCVCVRRVSNNVTSSLRHGGATKVFLRAGVLGFKGRMSVFGWSAVTPGHQNQPKLEEAPGGASASPPSPGTRAAFTSTNVC